jgi:hypothetical protein
MHIAFVKVQSNNTAALITSYLFGVECTSGTEPIFWANNFIYSSQDHYELLKWLLLILYNWGNWAERRVPFLGSHGYQETDLEVCLTNEIKIV